MPERLPNAENVKITPSKLRDYALNFEHDSGRYKAAFFAQMGYTLDSWQQLEQDIRQQHLIQPAEVGQPSPHGKKYVITAPLKGPNGSVRQVTTVWLFRPGNDFADLITIEPAARRKGS
jgi:hypothetical protein